MKTKITKLTTMQNVDIAMETIARLSARGILNANGKLLLMYVAVQNDKGHKPGTMEAVRFASGMSGVSTRSMQHLKKMLATEEVGRERDGVKKRLYIVGGTMDPSVEVAA